MLSYKDIPREASSLTLGLKSTFFGSSCTSSFSGLVSLWLDDFIDFIDFTDFLDRAEPLAALAYLEYFCWELFSRSVSWQDPPGTVSTEYCDLSGESPDPLNIFEL